MLFIHCVIMVHFLRHFDLWNNPDQIYLGAEMNIEVLRGFFLPVVFDLSDDSKTFGEFTSFFTTGYLEWDFSEKFKDTVGI